MFKVLTVEELAEDAFVKAEYLRNLGMANTPVDYDERKKAFVDRAMHPNNPRCNCGSWSIMHRPNCPFAFICT